MFVSAATGLDRKLKELLSNEKANFKLLAQTLARLGGVPLIAQCRDMSNTLPDEKVT